MQNDTVMLKLTNSKRGYVGIGVYHPKMEVNVGTLWRSALLYGADFLFTIGTRYQHQRSDTCKAPRHLPLWHFESYEAFEERLPAEAQVLCVELCETAVALPDIQHPERAIYLLGAEDQGLPEGILARLPVIQIPTALPYSLNVAVAGTLVLYDRYVKAGKHRASMSVDVPPHHPLRDRPRNPNLSMTVRKP